MDNQTPPTPIPTQPTPPLEAQNPPASIQPGKKSLLTFSRIVLLLVLLAILGFGAMYFLVFANLNKQLDTITHTDKQNETQPINACTQDVKLCPNGRNYVTRQGPKCEFAACPPK